MTKTNKTFTAAQREVIDRRGSNILVSASAGTGKTTVMIERIVSMIAEGADVEELVVVTFTTLAASEMKTRLSDRLACYADNVRMQEQLEKLDGAAICTLHSFCGDLLRNYFYAADVDPSFAVLDEAMASTLKNRALDTVFEEYFAEKDKDFYRVYKIFSTSRREESFRETLVRLYQFAACQPNFATWYAEKRTNFVSVQGNSPIISTLHEELNRNVTFLADTLAAIANQAEEDGVSFATSIRANEQMLRNVTTLTYPDALSEIATIGNKILALPKKTKKSTYAEIEAISEHAKIAKDLKELKEKTDKLHRGLPFEKLLNESTLSVQITDKLEEILLRFEEAYTKEKRKHDGLDFNDLEHLTLKILEDDVIKKEIQEKYKYIFVDEYQDTNPVQEAIVTQLCSGANLFMVGDVKQSIYGFRGCEPGIFVDKYNAYKKGEGGVAIELNSNFRSAKPVLDFANDVFDGIMTEQFGKVNYAETARLQGNAPRVISPAVTLDLLAPYKKEEEPINEIYDVTKIDCDDDGATQGLVIVKKIKSLVGKTFEIDGKSKKIEYGDIVILMRALTAKARDIYSALLQNNIPAVVALKDCDANTKEIKDLLCLLRTIDNPFNDVYLVGVCLSCIGKFEETELAVIRLDTSGRVPFVERLREYAAKNQNEIATKAANLLSLIDKIRFYSYGATVSDLLMYAIKITDYRLYVEGLPDGQRRMSKLFDYVAAVKASPHARSVTSYLNYVDSQTENAAKENASGADAVRIMTMHGSKGLEFPIVIIAGLENAFKFDYPSVETNVDVGMATNYYDFEHMRVSPTLGLTACNTLNKRKQREEEMRLLYVALTRAKYALYLVGTCNESRLNSSPKLPENANSHLDWIIACLQNKYGKNFANVHTPDFACNAFGEEEAQEQGEAQTYLCEQSTEKEELQRRLNYEYPFASQTEMPVKLVSSALDKEFAERQNDLENDAFGNKRKEFALHDNNDRAKVGTAYHKVYQYAPWQATKQQIADTIAMLTEQNLIDTPIAEKLDADLIFATLNNKEILALIEGKKAYHELPFMLYVPYKEIAGSDEFADNVMLQGVIDLLIIDDGKATVIDFKYTTKNEEKITKDYKLQLNSYKVAVQKILQIDDVDCYVLSVEDNKLIKI